METNEDSIQNGAGDAGSIQTNAAHRDSKRDELKLMYRLRRRAIIDLGNITRGESVPKQT